MSMDKQEFLKKYERNIAWLRRNIPPDDIYDFAEQTYMAALFFLRLASVDPDFMKLLQECPITRKWSQNLCSLLHLRDNNIDSAIDMKLEVIDDED